MEQVIEKYIKITETVILGDDCLIALTPYYFRGYRVLQEGFISRINRADAIYRQICEPEGREEDDE